MRLIRPKEFLDLTGVSCPHNIARILLKLETMSLQTGLKVIIDDGEPIKNVPSAIEAEGYKILGKSKDGDKWILTIEAS